MKKSKISLKWYESLIGLCAGVSCPLMALAAWVVFKDDSNSKRSDMATRLVIGACIAIVIFIVTDGPDFIAGFMDGLKEAA